MAEDKRKLTRKNFSFSMRVLDDETGRLIGYITDISTGGFRVEGGHSILVNRNFRLRVGQVREIAKQNELVFMARAQWCERDYLNPDSFNIGFQIVDMSPGDYDIFVRMYNTYGTQSDNSRSHGYVS